MCLRLTYKDKSSMIFAAVDLSLFVQDILFKNSKGSGQKNLVINNQTVCLNKYSTLR